jgi:hypothetical protein
VVAAVALAGCGGGGGSSSGGDGAPRATVQRYLAALGRGDAGAACRELSERTRERLAEFGREKLRTQGESCEATLGRALASPAGAALRRMGHLPVAGVSVEGARARVEVSGGGQPVSLVRSEGQWRIDSQPTGETD